jgi:hypothetical protein
MLYLYTGQRTNACRRLAITECTGVYRIRIESEEVVYLNNIILVPCELEVLAPDVVGDAAADQGRIYLRSIPRVVVVSPPDHDLTDYYVNGGDLRRE